MSDLQGRPTAAELVAAVAEFLEGDVRSNTTGAVNFHALVAANALRIVERELLDEEMSEPSLLPGWTNTRVWILARPLSGFAETFATGPEAASERAAQAIENYMKRSGQSE